MSNLAQIIARMQRQIAELQRTQANIIRSGPVVAVDPATQRVRIDIGDDANPLVTPWIRWGERAGARKLWSPPTVGEQMTVLSPAGKIDGTSIATPGGYTDTNGAPSSNGDAFAFSLGDVALEITDGQIIATAGGTQVTISRAGIAMTGPSVKHAGVEIGKDHIHENTRPSAGLFSGKPA